MGLLGEIQDRFDELIGSLKLLGAFKAWKDHHTALENFRNAEEMVAFLKQQQGTYEERDQMIWTLCVETQAKSRSEEEGQQPKRVAADLLLGMFVAALWRVFEEANDQAVLPADELDAEILLGFWEAASGLSEPKMASGKLVNGARHRAQRAIRRARREVTNSEDFVEETDPGADPSDSDWSDPWLVLCWAEINAVVDAIDSELIFWSRLNQRSFKEVADSLNLSYPAARQRRLKAERKLTDWLAEHNGEFPPDDAKSRQKILVLAAARASTRAFHAPS